MAYREYTPHPALKNLVECFWMSDGAGADTGASRIYPDGCADLLFMRDSRRTSISIVGTQTLFEDHDIIPGLSFFGIRFLPGGLHAFLRQPMHEFTDRVILLDDASARLRKDIEDLLKGKDFGIETVSALEGYLLLKVQDNMLPGLSRPGIAIQLIVNNNGNISMRDAAEKACLSPRQLERKFREQAGISPKALSAIIRFRRAKNVISVTPGHTLEEIAWDTGYYDYSHMYRDFMRMAGHSPEYFR